MTLREVLHAHIPYLTPASTVQDAVDKMDIYQFPALVVVDENERVIGVVTEGDLCRAVVGRGNLATMADDPASGYMSREPVVGGLDTEIGDAFHQMLSSGLTLLPVVADEKLMGIVLRVDLMHAMLVDRAEQLDPGTPA